MSKQSGHSKSDEGGKKKMVVTSFRLPESTLEAVKRKLGPFAIPSRIFRILVEMWLDEKIQITEDDIKKYGD